MNDHGPYASCSLCYYHQADTHVACPPGWVYTLDSLCYYHQADTREACPPGWVYTLTHYVITTRQIHVWPVHQAEYILLTHYVITTRQIHVRPVHLAEYILLLTMLLPPGRYTCGLSTRLSIYSWLTMLLPPGRYTCGLSTWLSIYSWLTMLLPPGRYTWGLSTRLSIYSWLTMLLPPGRYTCGLSTWLSIYSYSKSIPPGRLNVWPSTWLKVYTSYSICIPNLQIPTGWPVQQGWDIYSWLTMYYHRQIQAVARSPAEYILFATMLYHQADTRGPVHMAELYSADYVIQPGDTRGGGPHRHVHLAEYNSASLCYSTRQTRVACQQDGILTLDTMLYHQELHVRPVTWRVLLICTHSYYQPGRHVCLSHLAEIYSYSLCSTTRQIHVWTSTRLEYILLNSLFITNRQIPWPVHLDAYILILTMLFTTRQIHVWPVHLAEYILLTHYVITTRQIHVWPVHQAEYILLTHYVITTRQIHVWPVHLAEYILLLTMLLPPGRYTCGLSTWLSIYSCSLCYYHQADTHVACPPGWVYTLDSLCYYHQADTRVACPPGWVYTLAHYVITTRQIHVWPVHLAEYILLLTMLLPPGRYTWGLSTWLSIYSCSLCYYHQADTRVACPPGWVYTLTHYVITTRQIHVWPVHQAEYILLTHYVITTRQIHVWPVHLAEYILLLTMLLPPGRYTCGLSTRLSIYSWLTMLLPPGRYTCGLSTRLSIYSWLTMLLPPGRYTCGLSTWLSIYSYSLCYYHQADTRVACPPGWVYTLTHYVITTRQIHVWPVHLAEYILLLTMLLPPGRYTCSLSTWLSIYSYSLCYYHQADTREACPPGWVYTLTHYVITTRQIHVWPVHLAEYILLTHYVITTRQIHVWPVHLAEYIILTHSYLHAHYLYTTTLCLCGQPIERETCRLPLITSFMTMSAGASEWVWLCGHGRTNNLTKRGMSINSIWLRTPLVWLSFLLT